MKLPASHTLTVRNSRTGEMVIVKGAGALKDSGFAVKEGVDLTRPIADQVLTDKPGVTKQLLAG